MKILIRDLPYVDDADEWQKLEQEFEAETTNDSEKLDMLTMKVTVGFESLFANLKKKTKLEKKTKKKGSKNRPATSDQGEKGAWLIRKEQKMILRNKGVKRRLGSTSGEDEEDEDYLLSKKKQQKRNSGNEKKKINHKQRNLAALLSFEPPADMPKASKNCIDNLGGNQIQLVFLKMIYATDLSDSHNRLSMSKKKVRNKFLSEEEEEEVSKHGGGMDVILVEPCLEVTKVHLTKWLIGGSKAYVFITQWHQVVLNNPNTLKEKAMIQIWSFRVDSQLGFALIPVGDAKDIQQS